MGRRLNKTVFVTDSEGGMVAFGPDDDVPAWAAQQITHPALWADNEASSDEPGNDTPDLDPDSDLPPKAGKGSGVDVWRDYAVSHGIDVADDAGRDEIIAAVEASR